MQRKNFYLKEEQIVELNKITKKTGATISELIRRALDEYLKKNGVKDNDKNL